MGLRITRGWAIAIACWAVAAAITVSAFVWWVTWSMQRHEADLRREGKLCIGQNVAFDALDECVEDRMERR